jgi:DNA repair ATPase RecN
VITLVGIVILNETSSPISGTALSSTKKIHTEPRSCWKLTKALHSSEIQRLSQINLLSEKDETVGTSQFETSWTSLMNTLEKIQRMIDDLRRLVETLHQLTQAFIAVVNELSYWIDQVSIDPNVLSSI